MPQSCAETPAPIGTERSARRRSRLKLSQAGCTGSACSTLAASAALLRPLYVARSSASMSVSLSPPLKVSGLPYASCRRPAPRERSRKSWQCEQHRWCCMTGTCQEPPAGATSLGGVTRLPQLGEMHTL